MSLGLSNSEMDTWRRCPRKWYLSTYRRLTPRVGVAPGSALSIGNLVHDALAAYYDHAQSIHPVEYAAASLSLAIQDSPAEEAALTEEYELVQIMLSGYMEWLEETGADSDLRILGSESMVRVPLRNAQGEEIGITLLSKLDAPIERISDGAKLALEHKTTDSFSEQTRLEFKINAQFLTEHLARFLDSIEKGATPDEAHATCTGVLVNLIRKVKRTAAAKPPFYAREEIHHNIIELRNHWLHVVAKATEITQATARLDAGESHHSVCPPTPIKGLCHWDCQFFRVCHLADDGSDFEGALDAVYVEHDPLERYAGAEEF